MAKGPDAPGVFATRVIDIVPFQQIFPTKMSMITCDDIIEDELAKKAENNDFLLMNFTDKQDAQKKLALYKFNDCETIPEDIQVMLLGKRSSEATNLGSLDELE